VAPDESDACFTAAERAQPLMRQRRLREARVELEMCARDACPRVARSDCRSWLANVINQQPTIVIVAHEVRGTEVRDLHGFRATIDGAILVENADRNSVAIDPGPHRLHLEREGGDAVEQDVDIREGEKNRIVHVYWRGPVLIGEVPQPSSPTPPAVYLLGGFGAAAAAAGIGLEIAGLYKRSIALDQCHQNNICDRGEFETARNIVAAGDISLGAAAVLFGIAGYIYFTRPVANTSLRGGNVTWALSGTPRAFAAGFQGTW
jgi:hypothetical protein